MKTAASLIGGIGSGALLMYLFDPNGGRRRRAQARDRARRFVHQSEGAILKAGRDAGNRARGLASEARAQFGRDEVYDDVLVARVRARIGHFISHPGIEVTARDGVITLRGRLPGNQLRAVVKAAASARGVERVENLVEEEAPQEAGDRRKRPGFIYLRSYWPPSARLLAALAGGTLAGWSLRLRDVRGLVMGVLGGGLFARALANKELGKLLGYSSGSDVITIRKAVHIAAPIERVFEFWANYENFPRFMTHLREVRDLGNRRSLWIASGPAGKEVQWFAEVTRLEPNSLFGWKTMPGSAIEMSGRVKFDSNPDGTTRVDIQMSYRPPAGALGHAVASVFGADPKHAMNDDLARLKSLLEHGKTSAHGQEITKHRLPGVARSLVPGQPAAE